MWLQEFQFICLGVKIQRDLESRGSEREDVAERGQIREGREQVAKTVNFFLEQAGVTFGEPNYVQITWLNF